MPGSLPITLTLGRELGWIGWTQILPLCVCYSILHVYYLPQTPPPRPLPAQTTHVNQHPGMAQVAGFSTRGVCGVDGASPCPEAL